MEYWKHSLKAREMIELETEMIGELETERKKIRRAGKCYYE
jgi:hypothetical protein